MARFKVEIKGLEDLSKTLTTFAPREAANLLQATGRAVAAEALRDMKSYVRPVKDTGVLLRAMSLKRGRSTPFAPVFNVFISHGPSVAPSKNAYYWHMVEYGTRGKSGRPRTPYIRPVEAKVRATLSERVRVQFGKKLIKALAKRAKK